MSPASAAPSNASVSAWQVMALESAKVGGLEVPQEALDSAAQQVDTELAGG
jgi:Rod binding domain-containing protein